MKAVVASRPDLIKQVREAIASSGLTADQIRARLRAQGYPESLLDDYLSGADTTQSVKPTAGMLDALRSLGVVSPAKLDSLRSLSDSALAIADSLRADSLDADRDRVQVFGLDVFRKTSTRFDPSQTGPVDDSYALGPGDGLVLILSGDVEQVTQLDVTRDGFVLVPRVGQLPAAGLSLGQFKELLATRLQRVYSGVTRANTGTTRFAVTVSSLRQIQVHVAGDVARPGAYRIGATGGVLAALYAAGGPTAEGSFRRVLVNRGQQTLDSLDVYEYLVRGIAGSRVSLQSGDIVFVPPRGAQVHLSGGVLRPAVYEVRPSTSLRELIALAGGFRADADRRRVQVHRITSSNGSAGRRTLLEVVAPSTADSVPAVPLVAGDSVVVFLLPPDVQRRAIVSGNVWRPGPVGVADGTKLSEALQLAGGVRPGTYEGSVTISRLMPDSSRRVLRTTFADSTGRPSDDLGIMDGDSVTVFAISEFRAERHVFITGAVRKQTRVPYLEGMTLRDALLAAGGVTEDALLTEAEIARLPEPRQPGQLATTLRVPLDSTYLFERDRGGRYNGPPGLQSAAGGAAEVELRPYDNVLILRQPEWELHRTVSIAGQVRFPGRYALRTRGERLTDLIERAGGLTSQAYAEGVEFHRNSGRQGRIGVDLPRVLRQRNYRDNLQLVAGDSIVVPEYNPVVRVLGAVNAPLAIAYVPNKPVSYYLDAAGGTSRIADARRVYVTQPSGKVETGSGRRPRPGSVIIVPEKDPNQQSNTLQTIATLSGVLASLSTVLIVALTR